MIKFLRRLRVRHRLAGGFLSLFALMLFAAPLIVWNQQLLLDRLQQVTDVETRADRLLLLAAVRAQSSRVNLMRYVQDYAPSPLDAQRDVEQVAYFLQEATRINPNENAETAVAEVLVLLEEYRGVIDQVRDARAAGEEPDSLLFEAYRLGNDIEVQISGITQDNEKRVTTANQEISRKAEAGRIGLFGGYGLMLALALALALLLERSITRPIAELRGGAEQFLQGNMEATVPVVGADELSLLAQTFNRMSGGLRNSQVELLAWTTELENRVEQRTRELAQALDQLQQESASREQLLRVLREVSSPVIPLMQGIVVMPIVGALDSERAQRVVQDLLASVEHDRARVVLLDITGLAVMDTAVANALLQAARAVRLLGAEAILVGISPEIAETLVQLGVQLDLRTAATLEQGLYVGLKLIGKS